MSTDQYLSLVKPKSIRSTYKSTKKRIQTCAMEIFAVITRLIGLVRQISEERYLDAKVIDELIEKGKNEENQEFSDLKNVLDEIFSNPKKLSKSFCYDSAERQNDKEIDCKGLRDSMKKIFDLKNDMINNQINNAIIKLSELIDFYKGKSERYINCFLICFDLTYFAEFEYFALSTLCHATHNLPVEHSAQLARIWAARFKDNLSTFVQTCQRKITQIIVNENVQCGHENYEIRALTKVLNIAFYVNILTGKMKSLKNDISKFHISKLEKKLGISIMNSCNPLIPFEDFYNHSLSKIMEKRKEMSHDYLNLNYNSNPFIDEEMAFSFIKYSFILSPMLKVKMLSYRNSIQMLDEQFVLRSFILNVRREYIIDDALFELKNIAKKEPKTLRKHLTVNFEDEIAIDHGGVSKEFFQVIADKMFSPDFGLFVYQEDTKTLWFNTMLLKNKIQFKFAGIILGLAIYNDVILPLNFPMVFYRKLLGIHGSFDDLENWNPTIYQSLKSLLDYKDDDMEEYFMQTFEISYSNVDGKLMKYKLKPNGDNIPVGQHNKQEFVNLYSDYLLNKSIREEFQAFKKGFEMVINEVLLKQLFRPDEFELLICGNKTFDFVELEQVTKYSNGCNGNSQIIKDFWSIVHNLPDEMKRKLLLFTTGSENIPVGGFCNMKFKIECLWPDDNRLPSSSTCYNILFLPKYSSKNILKERLLKALEYSKGFGII